MIENRRSRRKHATTTAPVTNALTGETIGSIGNLSSDGMLLIANRELVENALFQFAFDLPEGGESSRHFEIGVHEQWGEPASTPGQWWAGFRIIDIAPDDRTALTAWIDKHDEALG